MVYQVLLASQVQMARRARRENAVTVVYEAQRYGYEKSYQTSSVCVYR